MANLHVKTVFMKIYSLSSRKYAFEYFYSSPYKCVWPAESILVSMHKSLLHLPRSWLVASGFSHRMPASELIGWHCLVWYIGCQSLYRQFPSEASL